MSLDSSTLAELDALTLDELDELYLYAEPTMDDADLLSLLQFNLRAFTRILPAGLSTTGELSHLLGLYSGIEVGEVEGAAYYPPRFTIARRNVATLDIERLNVGTLDVARRHVGVLEVERG